MSSSATENMRLIPYSMRFGGDDVGVTTRSTTRLSVAGNVIVVDDAEQFVGPIKAVVSGRVISLATELKEVSPQKIAGLQLAHELIETSGADIKVNIGNQDVDLEAFTKELVMHPSGRDIDDFADDWIWHKTAIRPTVELIGNNQEFQRIPAEFLIFPDLCKQTEKQYGAFSNRNISQATPHGVFIAMRENRSDALMHIPAATVPVGGDLQLQVYEAQSEASATNTAAINQGGGITATATSFPFDTGAVANGITPNSFIRIGTEVIKVLTITYATASTGTIDSCVRGVHGTTAAVHADDAVITALNNVGVTRVTNLATWASDTPAAATVGDTFNSSSQNKGLVTHVAAGSTNVDATFAGVTSPDIVITAA